MKKILIVLNDSILLSVFKSWIFRSQKKDDILLAKNSKEAVDIMASDISFFVTELNWSEIESLELLAGLSCYCPSVKIIIMVPPVSAAIKEQLNQLNSFSIVEKPNTLKDLVNLVTMIETNNFSAMTATDMVITDFLQLVEIYKASCLLSIEDKESSNKGFICFENGILYDAIYQDHQAEDAILEIINWQHTTISFKVLDKKRQFRRKINHSISQLINLETNQITEQPVVDLTVINETATEDNIAEFEALRVKINALILEQEPLNTLQNSKHYLAFTIFDMSGKLLFEHHISDYNVENFGIDITVMIKSALDTFNRAELGVPNYMQVNADSGIFAATWIVENQLIAAIFLTPDANLGLAKLNLNKTCDLIRKQLD